MLEKWIRHAFSLGWVCIRSHTKGGGHVALDEWAKSPARPTLEECLVWAATGGNVEVLLQESGLLQVDAEHGAPDPWGEPAAHATIISRSASGGLHGIYQAGDLPKRRWIKPVPLVDLLTKGVWPLPGCRRDGDARKPAGAWVELAEPCLPAPAPAWVLAAVPRPTKPAARIATARAVTGSTPRARAAFKRELAATQAAPEGQRHHTLLRAASNLGQLIAAGELDEAEVRGALEAVARQTQPDQLREALRAIDDGIDWGRQHPRADAPRLSTIELLSPATAIDEPPEVGVPLSLGHVCREVLVPGGHKDASDQYHEQSSSAFAAAVLDAIPPGTLYRRDVVPGVVHGARFHHATEATIRRLCDKPHVKLVKWVKAKGEAVAGQVKVYEQCSSAAAALILDAASHALPELRVLTSYPVLLPDGSISRPGYNAVGGVYYAGQAVEPEQDRNAIREHLLDLIVDFPFEDSSSRANCLGMLLTPMLRLLVGKVPLHLVTSPMPGTGKTRLVEQVLGISYMGEELSSSQLPEKPEDRAKWLIALLLSGDTLVHLDNLTAELDSANLASLLTSARVSDRLLGSSTFLRLENQLTIAATGNNTQLSTELARRTVIVRLSHPDPEHRKGWQHPDCAAHALASRVRTLECLAGLALLADPKAAGEALGSFEAWSLAVGSALHAIGIGQHLGNSQRWREDSDSEDATIAQVVAMWALRYGDQRVTASDLAAIPEVEQVAEGSRRVGRLLASLRDRRVRIGEAQWATVTRDGWSSTRNPTYRLRMESVS